MSAVRLVLGTQVPWMKKQEEGRGWGGRGGRWREQEWQGGRRRKQEPTGGFGTVLKPLTCISLGLSGPVEGGPRGKGRGRNPEWGEERAQGPGYSDGMSWAAMGALRGLPGGWGCPLGLDLELEMPPDEETEVLRAGVPAGPLAAPARSVVPVSGARVDLVLREAV